jgi:hypothetical protein
MLLSNAFAGSGWLFLLGFILLGLVARSLIARFPTQSYLFPILFFLLNDDQVPLYLVLQVLCYLRYASARLLVR